MPLFVCQAILFDLDGVLVDSTACVARIWDAWAREHQLDPAYVVQVTHGRRTVETVRLVAPHLDAQREADNIEQRELNDTDGLRVLPGAKETLLSIPPDRYTIVTSGTRRLATKRLQTAGLPVPTRMITADDVTNGKPDPEPYLAGAKLLGSKPQDCLVFEDAPSGILAAKAGQIRVIALATTYTENALSQADCIAESLASVKVELGSSGELNVSVADLPR